MILLWVIVLIKINQSKLILTEESVCVHVYVLTALYEATSRITSVHFFFWICYTRVIAMSFILSHILTIIIIASSISIHACYPSLSMIVSEKKNSFTS